MKSALAFGQLFLGISIMWILIFQVSPDASGVWPSDPRVNVPICTADDSQGTPQLVSDGAGGAIITWLDWRTGSADIYAQRVSRRGRVLWTTNGVPICAAGGSQSDPQPVSDGTGGAIITWEDYRSGSWHIYAQRVDASGRVLWTTNGVPICTAEGGQGSPQLVSDGAGGAIIMWVDNRSSDDGDIYAQRVDADGTMLWTTNGVPICTAAGDQGPGQLVSDGAGGAIITWQDERTGSGNYDIYAQRVDLSGSVLWTTDGVPISTVEQYELSPKLVSDGAGGAIITWGDYGTGGWNIYAQRVDANGNVLWTTDSAPISTTAGDQQLVGDGAGGAIITWEDLRNAIYAQRVDASGNVLWTTDGVPICTAANTQWDPQLVSDGAGGAIITWDDYRSSCWDIYAQRVDASGNVVWTIDGVPICTAREDHVWPQLVSDGARGAIITWGDYRRSGITNNITDIFAQNVNPDGTLGGISGDGLPAAAAPIRPVHQVTLPHSRAEWQSMPLATQSFPNYPNPFNPETWIPYQLAKAAQVIIRIYDVQGHLIRTLDLGERQPGVYLEKSRAAHWNGRNQQGEPVPGGVYFYTLNAGGYQATHKLVILK